MVIENEQGVMITQYDMAEEFGVTIPVGYELNVNNIYYSNNDNEYGVHLNEKILNEFFEKKNINIRATYFHINPFEDLEIDEYDKLDIGHVALLWDVVSENELLIYDSGPRNAGIKKVNRHNMYDAMRCRHSGIYVLERIKE